MKGEHRGAAKRQAKRGGPPPGVSGNPDGRPKGGKNRATMERIRIVSEELGVEELNGIMPKQMLVNISRIFYKMAMNDQMELESAEARAKEQTAQEGPVQDIVTPGQVAEIRGSFKQNLVLAGDHAYKAANYYHPRLQALAIAGANGDKSAGDVLREMLDEIDGEGRELKQIKHRPQQTLEAQALDGMLDNDDEEKVA